MIAEAPIYSAYGLSIASELPLPELPSTAGPADIFIRLGAVPHVGHRTTLREQYVYGTQAGAFHVTNGDTIVADPLPGAEAVAVRIVLLGRVMASLLWQRGWLPLHASGVIIGRKGVLFVAPSGTGKSTVAAALHARGHAVITDDVAPVAVHQGVCRVLPSWPRLRLTADTLGMLDASGTPQLLSARTLQIDKYNVALRQPRMQEPVPLHRIYFLESGTEMTIEPVATPLAVASLNAQSFIRQRRCDVDAALHHLKGCAAIAGAVRLSRITNVRGRLRLAELSTMIEEDSVD